MDEQVARTQSSQVDYGEALRKAKAMRRCLPAVGIHWIEPGDEHCQCGRTGPVKRPVDRNNN